MDFRRRDHTGGSRFDSDIYGADSLYSGHSETAEDTGRDEWRILLIELTYLLASHFIDLKYWDGVRKDHTPFAAIVQILKKLRYFPSGSGPIQIRSRRSQTGKPGEDYLVEFGGLYADIAMGTALMQRLGVRMSHLAGRLAKAFQIFYRNDIRSLTVHFPGDDHDDITRFETALDIVGRFHRAKKENTSIRFQVNGDLLNVSPVLDDNYLADPNLTLIAALNRLSPEKMQGLVRNVSDWMYRSGDSDHATVFEAMTGHAKLKKMLIFPLLEVNVDRRLRGSGGNGNGRHGSQRQAGEAGGHPNRRSRQDHSKRIAPVNGAASSPLSGGGVSYDIENRLSRVAEALESTDQRVHKTDRLLGEVLNNLQSLVNQRGEREQIFGAAGRPVSRSAVLSPSGGPSRRAADRRSQASGMPHATSESVYRRLAELSKRQLTRSDIHSLCGAFGVSHQDIFEVFNAIRSCMDERGFFLRAIFEQNIPVFVRHESISFECIWHYFQDILKRKDRVSFLNSMQVLLTRGRRPERFLQVLLSDFLRQKQSVRFSDRNALMLSTILLRKYNKELDTDIEITPEEVLQIENGMNPDAIRFAVDFIEVNRQQVFEKLRTIHRHIRFALNPGQEERQPLPLRYLFALEREVFIFLALINGKTARSVLVNAVRVYGNPAADLFFMEKSREYAHALLQHLKVAVRGLGRVGNDIDIQYLDDIQRREAEFLRPDQSGRLGILVRQIMEWANHSRRRILGQNR